MIKSYKAQFLYVWLLITGNFVIWILCLTLLQALVWQTLGSDNNQWHSVFISLTYLITLLCIALATRKYRFTNSLFYYPGIRQTTIKPEMKFFWQKNQSIVHNKTPSLWIVIWLEIPIGLAILVFESQYLMSLLIEPGEFFYSINKWMLQNERSEGIAQLLGYIVIVSVCESLFFQGYLQGLLRKLPHKSNKGHHIYMIYLIWINLLFAISFFNIWQSIPLFFLGMILSWIRNISKSIWSVIIIRCSVTTLLILFEIRYDSLEFLIQESKYNNSFHFPFWLTGLAFLMVGNASYYLYKRSRLQNKT